ncbi:hypothetical protein D082_04670 [Synechocystis sp. PCC 6714]|nr:hypothetical protein D082_04670 [Synechocystis sp. PCC 6714]
MNFHRGKELRKTLQSKQGARINLVNLGRCAKVEEYDQRGAN